MRPATHHLYTAFLNQSPQAYTQTTTRHHTIQDREAFARAHYLNLFDDTICDYRRSYDYRHGAWYRRTIRLRVYYNILDQHLDITLVSRIVDRSYVDRTTPLVETFRCRPSECQTAVYRVLEATPALLRVPRVVRTTEVWAIVQRELLNERNRWVRVVAKVLRGGGVADGDGAIGERVVEGVCGLLGGSSVEGA